jgi:hypothetical protein
VGGKTKFFCHGIAARAFIDFVDAAVPVTRRASARSVWEKEWRSLILCKHLFKSLHVARVSFSAFLRHPCSIAPILFVLVARRLISPCREEARVYPTYRTSSLSTDYDIRMNPIDSRSTIRSDRCTMY